ncbi:MAG: ferrous iron transport protein A [Bifidobacteriaceae bacterium]|jgi:ferrous iron transport protein A|nr:ferrous iron transport protein A [Bifidobacteriaceae bacterium]
MAEGSPTDLVALRDLPVGASGRVVRLAGQGPTKHRLLELGLTPGARLTVNRVAPLGDPVQIMARGARLSLRKADAAIVLVKPDAVDPAAD